MTKSIELEVAALKNDLEENNEKNASDKEGKEKVLEAKIEDLSDRLRLGMNKLQVSQSSYIRRESKNTFALFFQLRQKGTILHLAPGNTRIIALLARRCLLFRELSKEQNKLPEYQTGKSELQFRFSSLSL